MLISNIKELNNFVSSRGGIRPELLVPELAESKVLVSANIARLILKLSPEITVRHNCE